MNRLFLIFSTTALILAVSCTKIDNPVIDSGIEPLKVVSLTEDTLAFKNVSLLDDDVQANGYEYLTSILDASYYYDPDALYARATESIASIIESVGGEIGIDRTTFEYILKVLYSKDMLALTTNMFFNNNGAAGRFEEYKFRYWSTSATGEKIQLTGVVIFPNYQTDGTTYHTLDNLTLLHDSLRGKEEYVSNLGHFAYLRSIYNQAVIVSDYEGYNETADAQHPYVSANELARQAVDCALAAMEVLDYVGVNLKKGYKVYNMGMSKGASPAIAAQRMLENYEPAEISTKLPIASTYVGTGLYDFKGMMIKNLQEIKEGTSTYEENLQMSWIAATVVKYAYLTHPDAFKDIEGFEGLKSFFCDFFYTAAAIESDILINPAVNWDDLEYYFKYYDFITMDEIFNPNFFKDGEFNEEDPLLKKLFEVLDEENPVTGWSPKAPILMEHSKDDTFSIYEVAYQNYKDLKNYSSIPNLYVNFHTYSGLNHVTMSGVASARMALFENPALPLLFNF